MKVSLTTFLIFISFFTFSQGEFQFETETHDFGNILEGTQAKHVFKFKNIGNAPIVISNVQASCGCTTPSYSKEPILPGAEGEITAVYNSQGRIGQFSKSINITSNAKSTSYTVFIKGLVSKEPPKVFSEEEKANSPKIQFEMNEYNFGKANKGEQIRKTFSYTNTGKKDLIINKISSTCNCVVLANGEENILKPGEKGTLTFIYTPKGVSDRKDIVYIESNDIITPRKELVFRAFVNDNSVNMLKNSSSPF